MGRWAWAEMKFVGIAVPCIWENNREAILSERLQKKVPMVLPEAFETYSGELEKSISPHSLRGRTIQCIVKLANIHLTPDNPKYKGGSWHVEVSLVNGTTS
jgi:glutathionyl-hydroquinone reductase